jgi:hypothetical protein
MRCADAGARRAAGWQVAVAAARSLPARGARARATHHSHARGRAATRARATRQRSGVQAGWPRDRLVARAFLGWARGTPTHLGRPPHASASRASARLVGVRQLCVRALAGDGRSGWLDRLARLACWPERLVARPPVVRSCIRRECPLGLPRAARLEWPKRLVARPPVGARREWPLGLARAARLE